MFLSLSAVQVFWLLAWEGFWGLSIALLCLKLVLLIKRLLGAVVQSAVVFILRQNSLTALSDPQAKAA